MSKKEWYLLNRQDYIPLNFSLPPPQWIIIFNLCGLVF